MTEHALAVQVERRIYLIRREKVMLDYDLAELYGVSTRILNQAVKRNRDRFPEDFMFRLSKSEAGALRSQIVILEPLPLTVSAQDTAPAEEVPGSWRN